MVACWQYTIHPKGIKMDPPLKTKPESHVAQVELDLQNKIIDFIQQSILPSFVGTR